ncbi:MAG TPA: acetolactate synthase large subunit [Balneolales bacterium]|nr:acetolactate synthase large subunit [Balneolales bacterium]
MKASDLLVKALENEGVQYIFALPGEENLDILDSLSRSDIELVITRHEQAAGFMAATYGRLTEKTGVCMSTLGPGATNLVTAAAYAQLGGYPVLMLTGQKPIKKHKQGKFQVLNVVDMMSPLVKYSEQIKHGSLLPATIRQSFRIAEAERPGAVHLEIPEDIAREDADPQTYPVDTLSNTIADQKSIDRAVSLIHKARHPLILIGAGANRLNIADRLTRLIDETGIPFFTTQMGKGVVDERHALWMGTAAISEHDFVHAAIDKADLIINFGHDIVEKPPFFMNQNDTLDVIHIHHLPANIDEVYFPQCEIIGDIAYTIDQLSQKITPQDDWDFKDYAHIRQEFEKHLAKHANDSHFPLKPQRLVADIRKELPNDGILALDNGMYKIWVARNFKAYSPATLLLDNALASMGAGLPSAIAASLIHPDKKVVALCGDGGFMMNSQELETAIRLNVNLVVLVLRDSAYGMIKWKQETMEFKDFGLDFGNPDFVDYANSFGARGHRIEKTAEFREVLNQCLETEGVDVIDVPVDYSENVDFFKKDLEQLTSGL